MLDLMRLFVVNILGPMLEEPSKTAAADEEDEDEDELLSDSGGDESEEDNKDQEDNNQEAAAAPQSDGGAEREMKRQRMRRARHRRAKRGLKDTGLLDADGPKLIHGERAWLLMYQIVGQVNLLGRPFYMSLIYKCCVFTLATYVGWTHFIGPIIESKIIVGNYKNPIFLFIAFLAGLVTLLHAVLILYSNLFNLCPFFKVLTTPRLCFIKSDVQHMVGTRTLAAMTLFYIYNGILLKLISYNDFNEFFTRFSLWTFLLDSFCATCLGYLLVGVYQLDFYIRVCFGFWIIAMKTNLEYRFAYLQRHQRLVRQLRLRDHSRRSTNDRENDRNLLSSIDLNDDDDDEESSTSSEVNRIIKSQQSAEQRTLDSFKDKYKIDTLNEIQKNLNTMDDHLEVCRSIQNTSLVLITLNAFLSNGAMLLLAYNLLANRGNYYHGILVILIFMNNTIFVFLCYIGDSWISYALSSFVQTVEDEYFLQGGDNAATLVQQQQQSRTRKSNNDNDQDLDDDDDDEQAIRLQDATSRGESAISGGGGDQAICRQHQSLFLIKKQDVLFCREFLHQFENHLATPWSKLTVKIHINMLGTFVTLVAAQIIFDREH